MFMKQIAGCSFRMFGRLDGVILVLTASQLKSIEPPNHKEQLGGLLKIQVPCAALVAN
jgi:hypothetical protein